MPVHHQETLMPYTPRQVFDLVADVASYPKFLPWCSGARILQRSENTMRAQLLIKFKAFRTSYTSDIVMVPPVGEVPGSIDVKLVEGPFKTLTNHWEFLVMPDGRTRIMFDLEFQFESRMLETLIGSFFEKAVKKMVGAFETRAKELYGSTQLI